MAETSDPLVISMNRRRVLGILVVSAMALPTGPVLAHALPGSVVTIMPRPDGVVIRIEVALDDIALALPSAGLGDNPLTPSQQEAVATYLPDHVRLTSADGQRLRLTGTGLALYSAHNDHVGDYTLLVADLFLTGKPDYPLQLDYDVVMHEVRSHTATVFVQTDGSAARHIGKIRIDPATGHATQLAIPPVP